MEESLVTNGFRYYQFFSGALLVENLIIALIFLRFWKKANDRFFGFFSFAFGIMGLERLLLVLGDVVKETSSAIYILRLFAFLLIIWAVIDKNKNASRA